MYLQLSKDLTIDVAGAKQQPRLRSTWKASKQPTVCRYIVSKLARLVKSTIIDMSNNVLVMHAKVQKTEITKLLDLSLSTNIINRQLR